MGIFPLAISSHQNGEVPSSSLTAALLDLGRSTVGLGRILASSINPIMLLLLAMFCGLGFWQTEPSP